MDKKDYIREVERQIKDPSTYRLLKGDPTKRLQVELESLLTEFLEKDTISQKEKEFLMIAEPAIPVIYVLPKVHKSLVNPPGRPIVAGTVSLTSNLSLFIDKHLQPFMNRIPSFLKDTTHFLNVLKNIVWKEGYKMITADVTSLYTIIAHDEGVKAINHFLTTSNLSPNLQEFLTKGIRFILSNNNFYFEGNFYLQVQGTAMGTRFNPCYANIFCGKMGIGISPYSRSGPGTMA